MHDNDTPGRAGSGSSTEDIAATGSSSQDTGRGTDGGFGRASDAPPTYPGESIATSGEGDTPRENGTETGTDSDTTGAGGAVGDRGMTESGGGPSGDGGVGVGTGGFGSGGTGGFGSGGTGGFGSGGTGGGSADETPRLMAAGDEEDFRTRWRDIQSLFVDDPREAVHAADSLVADVMQKLAATFADHRRNLEGQWQQGEDVDTERLRTALRQYRSFFHRLLSTGAEQGAAGSGDARGGSGERPDRTSAIE
ncbi:hypothetical protein [Streptomyces sp. NPDC003327]